MAERGIDIADEYPKHWTDEILEVADVIITMSCSENRSTLPGPSNEDWAIADSDTKDAVDVRPIRDEIEGEVRRLLDELQIPGRA